MRNFSIDLIWAKIQIAITAIDGLMIALMIFMGLDYVTGVMCAIIDKKLSSAVGFKGICKKVLILFMVGIANIVDLHVIGSGSAAAGRGGQKHGPARGRGHDACRAACRG